MGIERRSQERIRVRFPCEVELDGKREEGMVRDLSAGGLCVLTELSVQEGDDIRVTLHPKGHPTLDVQAMVWNLHGVRSRRSGERSTRLGLVLSEAGDAFLDLLDACEPASSQEAEPKRPATGTSKRPATGTSKRPATGSAKLPAAKPGRRPPKHRHRVRVRQSASSRTRTLVVFAASSDEARARALDETGDDWNVLDVTRERSRPGTKKSSGRTRGRG